MSKYLKNFSTHNQYDQALSAGDIIKHNVSYDIEHVHYDPQSGYLIYTINVTDTTNPTTVIDTIFIDFASESTPDRLEFLEDYEPVIYIDGVATNINDLIEE